MKLVFYWLVALLCCLLLFKTPVLLLWQVQAWAWCMELAAPSVVLIICSAAYCVVLAVLTVWYWWWRGLRWIFGDEGPLPRFRALLLVLWLPVTLVPTYCVVLMLALAASWVKIRQEMKKLQ